MNIPIPAQTPDPNIDDPTLPPPVPEQDPDELPVKPTLPPTEPAAPPEEEPPQDPPVRVEEPSAQCYPLTITRR